jgi:hypothetical protein
MAAALTQSYATETQRHRDTEQREKRFASAPQAPLSLCVSVANQASSFSITLP